MESIILEKAYELGYENEKKYHGDVVGRAARIAVKMILEQFGDGERLKTESE